MSATGSLERAFAQLLEPSDARRATAVIETLLAHGFRGALTGGLAIDAQLRVCGRPVERRPLNDIDFVVDSFESIPESLAGSFLVHHVHPDATDGKTLLQLVDEAHRVRVDVFQALGKTLSRTVRLDDEPCDLDVLSIEDLVARSTSLVCGRLLRRLTIAVKHVSAFERLRGLGEPAKLSATWNDHRQRVPGTLDEASCEAARVLDAHPELVVVEQYSSDPVACERCRQHGPFRPASSSKVIEVLGYC
jgi:hypothetical protein